MLVTTEELSLYSGVYPDSTDLQNIYIGAATEIISNYVGYDPESNEDWKDAEGVVVVPDLFKLVCLEIATLMQQEESQNLGINSKSFAESGSRTFLNVVNYDKYLLRLAEYKKDKALTV